MFRITLLLSLLLATTTAPSSDPIEQKLYLSHCDGSSWYVSTEDSDSVTVRCDPKSEDNSDKDQPEDASAPVHLDSI
ncbi:MAG TPA: hypothetical protein VKP61_00060 [Candidatus Acidoferrum sp.]|nr:hypothetical protein [Candidatus Acidoferrum sp.]